MKDSADLFFKFPNRIISKFVTVKLWISLYLFGQFQRLIFCLIISVINLQLI